MDEKTTPTWCYHKTKEPQIFHLKDGDSLPRGWNDAPVAKPEEGDEPAEGASPADQSLGDPNV